ncbi:MAG: hypothetical protein AAFX94_19615, partial [Myxococcota bacterium]
AEGPRRVIDHRCVGIAANDRLELLQGARRDLVRSDAYAPMIDHTSRTLGEVELQDDTAAVPVILTTEDGRRFGYVFLLGRQRGGPLRNCWMTDGVQLVGEAPSKRAGEISL